jgi:hypothetical protein
MATATTSLRLIKQAQSDTGWGVLLNSGVMDVVDLAVAGTANISTTGGTTTLDNVDYVADNGKAAILNVTGALASGATIVIPNASKTYIVVNGTTNAQTLTIKTSSGSGITIPQGYTQKVRCDGSNGTTYASGAVVGSTGNLGASTILPLANDGGALGASGTAFSDLFLASGAVINFNNGDVTLTHSANTLAFAGASSGYTFDALATVSGAFGQTGASRFINTTDAATNQGLRVESDRATPTNNDTIFQSFYLSDSGGTQTELGRITVAATDVTDTSETSRMSFAVAASGTLATELLLTSTTLAPNTSDGLALGTGSVMWSDLFLASGGVINFNNGDVTLTHSANTLAFAGATDYTFDDDITVTNTQPVISVVDSDTGAVGRWQGNSSGGSMFFFADINNVGAGAAVIGFGRGGTTTTVQLDSTSWRAATGQTVALGSTTQGWSNLFLSSAGVINFNNGDVTLTHSTNTLAFAGASSGYTFDGIVIGSLAGVPARFTNTTDAAVNIGLEVHSDRATMASNDRVAIGLYMSDSAGNQDEFARVEALAASVTSASEAGQLRFHVTSAGSLSLEAILSSTNFSPGANDGSALGNTSSAWSDLFLASGGVVNFANGDVTITHATDTLTIAGAATVVDVQGPFQVDSFRIDQAASSIGTGSKTISNAASSSTNFGNYFSFSLNGTTVYVPCGTVAPT